MTHIYIDTDIYIYGHVRQYKFSIKVPTAGSLCSPTIYLTIHRKVKEKKDCEIVGE